MAVGRKLALRNYHPCALCQRPGLPLRPRCPVYIPSTSFTIWSADRALGLPSALALRSPLAAVPLPTSPSSQAPFHELQHGQRQPGRAAFEKMMIQLRSFSQPTVPTTPRRGCGAAVSFAAAAVDAATHPPAGWRDGRLQSFALLSCSPLSAWFHRCFPQHFRITPASYSRIPFRLDGRSLESRSSVDWRRRQH